MNSAVHARIVLRGLEGLRCLILMYTTDCTVSSLLMPLESGYDSALSMQVVTCDWPTSSLSTANSSMRQCR
jgi:hypothetical protein